MNYSDFYHVTIENEIEGINVTSMLDNGFVHPEMIYCDAHFHTAYEVHLCLAGGYTVISSSGKKTRLTPGKLAIIPPNCYHYTAREPETGLGDLPSKYSFRFTISVSLSVKDGKRIADFLPEPESDPVVFDAEWAIPLLGELRDEIIGGKRYNRILIDSLMLRFWIGFFREFAKIGEMKGNDPSPFFLSQSDTREAREEKIDVFINRNYASPITEKDLADSLNISVRQLSRICVDTFGKSFRDVLTEVRIRRAMRLLEETDIPSEQVSFDVGYAAPSSFYSVFRKKVGMTPSEYRKRVRRGT